MYLKKSDKLTSNSEALNLPDNGFYTIKDFMLYRAGRKFGNPNYMNDYKAFMKALDDMVLAANDRDSNLDECGIASYANV